MRKFLLGNADDRQKIIDKYPYTAQVIKENGNLFVAKNEIEEIIGFLWSFGRDIPAPIGNVKEEFINVVEVFDSNERCKGIGSLLVQECIKKAKNDKAYQVRAYCDINNIASHKLWAKNNFGISPVKEQNGNICGSFVTFVINTEK